MSRFRDIKRQARADRHREMSVPALYLPAVAADPVACAVRVWTKGDPLMLGELSGLDGAAQRVEPEDRLRFDLSDFAGQPDGFALRRGGVVAIAADEAWRLDHLYPADLAWQTARVTRLTADEIAAWPDGLPLPEAA